MRRIVAKMRDHRQQLEIFKAEAERLGLMNNFLFASTLSRYATQVVILQRLQEEIVESTATVERSYVRGEKNTYSNPLFQEFNRTASAANQTCSLLAKLRAEAEKRADEFDDDEL